MKVLFISPYITAKEHPGFQRNKTGFGLMVHDMANSIGQKAKVDLFAVNVMAPSIQMGTFTTIGRSWATFFSNITLGRLGHALKFLNHYRLPITECIRVIYQFCALGQIRNMIKDYDMVHIHGCTPITIAAIDLCRQKGVPVLTTLHGLVSFQEAVKLHPSLKQLERDFLLEADRKGYYVNFISSGNKAVADNFIKSMSRDELH